MFRVTLLFLLLAGPGYAQTQLQGPQGPEGDEGRTPVLSFAGPAVDAEGNPANDPTENVRALVDAEKQRNDDLRDQNQQNEILIRDLQQQLQNAIVQRLDQVRDIQFTSLQRQADLDRNSVTDANQAAIETAKDLALRVQQSAEVLSGQVATAAGTATDNLTRLEARIVASLGAIDARLVSLEQFQNQSFGQARVTDPQLQELTALVTSLSQASAQGSGADSGRSGLWGLIAGGVGLIIALIAFMQNQSQRRKDA